MRKISFILIFLISISVFSQEKLNFLIGEWKIICIQTHNIYYNSITDSLSYSDEFKKLIPDILDTYEFKNIDDLNKNTKKEYSDNTFVFNQNGTYLRTKNGIDILNGKYKIKTSNQIIDFKDKTKNNGTFKHYMEYSFHNNTLYLTSFFGNIIRPTIFTLKKIE